MFEIILSATASLLLLSLSFYVIAKGKTQTNISLSLSLFLLAFIEIADQLSLNLTDAPLTFKKAGIILESLLPLTFLFFSLTYARERTNRFLFLRWVLLAASLLFPIIPFLLPFEDFFYSPDLQIERLLFLGNGGYWFYIGMMIYCVASLVNIETTFGVSSGADRWKMKFDVMGVTAILSVLIFYFSQGLLYRTINMNLISVRSGVFIIASVLLWYSRLFRGNGVRIKVSRFILYRSLTLIVVGIYLITLALIGEGMRYFGVPFSRNLTIFIAFISGIFMLFVLFSEQMRRKVKVFINKHFYTHKYDYRAQWLKFTGRLSSCKRINDVQKEILSIYTESFGIKGASLYLLCNKSGRYTLATTYEMKAPDELNASEDLLSYFTEQDRVFDLFGGEYIPTEDENSFIQKTGVRGLVPLVVKDRVEGIVVLGEQLVKEKFIYEDYDLMKTLAGQAALSIVNFRLLEELAETREMAAIARVSSFVMHDLKNLTTNLSLLIDNAKNYMDDPEFQNDMIKTMRNTLIQMKDLIQKLKGVQERQVLNRKPVDLNTVIAETVDEILKAREGVNIVYQGVSAFSSVDVGEIKKVILNLILNAIDAIGEKGVVKIEGGANGRNAYIKVSDDGCGMPAEFINNHLFKPFRTTKKSGLGIGLYQCKQIVEAHNGRIEVQSAADRGSIFTVHLPFISEYVIQ